MKLGLAREILQAIHDDDPTDARAPALSTVLAELDRRGAEIAELRAQLHQQAEIERYRREHVHPGMTAGGFAALLPERLRPAYWRRKIGECATEHGYDPDAESR